MRGINSACIDLIYLDPPFNKKKVCFSAISSKAKGADFKDSFTEEDIKEEWLADIREQQPEVYTFINNIKVRVNFCYLVYMAIRIIEIHRILKEISSVYLHCDSTMSHYLKIVMDFIFGRDNFRNEIIWQRNNSSAKGSQHPPKSWGCNTDSILYYVKSHKTPLNPYRNLTEDEKITKFNKVDQYGRRYNTATPVFNSASMADRPNLCFEWRGFKNPHPSGWRLSKKTLEEEYIRGNIVIKNGSIERRKYIEDYVGVPLDNCCVDIPRNQSVNYPTQKPVKLLERIISASSKEGDMVLDPFCGGGTVPVAAERLNRQWIGIDISTQAYNLMKQYISEKVGIYI